MDKMKQGLKDFLTAILEFLRKIVVAIGGVNDTWLRFTIRDMIPAGLFAMACISFKDGVAIFGAGVFIQFGLPLICSLIVDFLDWLRERVEDSLKARPNIWYT